METRLLEPLHDVVIIKPQVLEKVGSIVIPIESKDFREDIGTVLYVGPGDMNDEGVVLPMFVKPGDRVLFSTHGHQVTKIDGQEVIVLRQNSIIAVFRDKEEQSDANNKRIQQQADAWRMEIYG